MPNNSLKNAGLPATVSVDLIVPMVSTEVKEQCVVKVTGIDKMAWLPLQIVYSFFLFFSQQGPFYFS
jgi:hypothetical protein